MFARYSVKRPYTVIVGVILAIVLGAVSFMNMRTDLLPNIDLPYVVVYTTYVGASPEEVETTVTKPMEGALASTTDLKSVQSVSSENVSMVILEYENGANMDTALIEISSAVSQIEGGWSDSIGSPVIMKLNPDMLPVIVASVDYAGKDIYELSDYVNKTLMSDMEGINGVASVETSGIIEQEITVTVRQSRIDAINNLILRDVDAELADVELQLDDAQAQLNQGKRQLSSAKKQTLAQIDEMIAQLEAGSAQMPATIAKLETEKAALQAQRTQLVAAIAQLENSLNQELTPEQQAGMEQLAASVKALENQRAALQAQLDAMGNASDAPTNEEIAAQQKIVSDLKTAVEEDETIIAEQQAYIDELSANGLTADEKAKVEQLKSDIAALNATITATENTITANGGVIETLQTQKEQQQAEVVAAEQELAAANAKKDEVTAAQTAVNTAQTALDATRAAITEKENAIASAEEGADTSALQAELDALRAQEPEQAAALESANAELAAVTEGWDAAAAAAAQQKADTARQAVTDTQASIDQLLAQNLSLRTEVTAATESAAAKQAELDVLNAKAVTPEDQIKLESAQQLKAEAEARLAENQPKLNEAEQKLSQMQAAQDTSGKDALVAQIAALDAQISAIKTSPEYLAYLQWQQLQQNPEAAQKQLAELKANLAQLDGGIAQMDAMITKLNSGILPGGLVEGMDQDTNMSDALKQLKAGRKDAVSQFSGAQGDLNAAAKELAEGRKEFEEQRDEALKNANINDLVTMQLVAQIIGAQNIAMPAGYVSGETDEYLVRVGDKFGSVDELKNLVLFKMGLDSVDEIRLMDVATVEITDNSDEVFAIVNGNPAVTLSFSKQSTASTTEVSDEILATFDELSQQDTNLRFTPLMDQGVYIDMIVSTVMDNLITGGILAVIILAIFLMNIRPTIIIACAIPLSVVAALVCMYFSDITLNIISLSGLSLAIGMLVDNSIVVIENIYRLRNEENMPILKACVRGANQVAGALFSSTLTTICVFLPIAFLEGMTRQLFQDMALTIAYSLLASLLIALTLVPAMSAVLLKKRRKSKERLFRLFQKCYCGLLKVCLKVKILVIAAAVGMLVFAVMQVPNMGMVFLENMSSNQLTVTLNMPAGATFEQTNAACADLVDAYMHIEGVDSVGVMGGGGGMMSMTGGDSGTGTESRSIYIVLNEDSGVTSYDID